MNTQDPFDGHFRKKIVSETAEVLLDKIDDPDALEQMGLEEIRASFQRHNYREDDLDAVTMGWARKIDASQSGRPTECIIVEDNELYQISIGSTGKFTISKVLQPTDNMEDIKQLLREHPKFLHKNRSKKADLLIRKLLGNEFGVIEHESSSLREHIAAILRWRPWK